jgi:hypothetical protein
MRKGGIIMKRLSQQELPQHVTILGWLYLVGYAFFLLIGAFVFTLLTSIGAVSGDEQAMMVLSLVGTSVGGLLVALAVPGMAAGFGLLARKVWGRYLAIVVAILGLINFPIGTLIGVYTLWVLMQEDATASFAAPQLS